MQRSARPVPRRAAAAACAAALALVLPACSAKQRDPDVIAGKQAFVMKCGSCHTLSHADTKGNVGPNLDEAFQRGRIDGLGQDAIRGIVRKQIQYPSRVATAGTGVMPANLAKGDQADNIADYVADVASKPGKDQGLLGSAVKKAGGGKPIAAQGGTLTIPTDPGGALAFTSNQATAKAGSVKVVIDNKAAVPHNIVIDGEGKTQTVQKGTSSFTADLKPGTYTFYCSVPGHRQAGMQGKITVK